MNAIPGCWRRSAVAVVQHAARMLPGARAPWAEAMRREVDYIEDDRAALRWAVGCVVASYTARLVALLRPRWRMLTRPAIAGGMLLFTALALQGHASDRAEQFLPAFEETACELPDVTPDVR